MKTIKKKDKDKKIFIEISGNDKDGIDIKVESKDLITVLKVLEISSKIIMKQMMDNSNLIYKPNMKNMGIVQ